MRKIVKLLIHEKWHFLGMVLLIVCVALTHVSTSYFHVWSYDCLVAKDFLGFLKFEVLSVFVWWFFVYLKRLQGVHSEMLITQITTKIRNRYVEVLARKQYYEFMEHSASDYAASLSNDIEMLETQGFSALLSIVETVLLMAFSIIALMSFHYSIVILTLVLTLVVTFLPRFLSKKAQIITERFLKAKNGYLSKNLDVLEGYGIFFSANHLALISKLISKNGTLYRNERINYARNYGLMSSLIALISVSSQILMAIYVGYLVTKNLATLGVILSAGTIANHVFNALTSFSKHTLSIKAIAPLLDKFNIEDSLGFESQETIEFTSLELDSLSVSFAGKRVLEKISLKFERGKKYAIVGESGSGKTTLFNAILGRIADYDGLIFFNDKNVKFTPSYNMANSIAYAQQDKHVFNDTIRNNLTLWKDMDGKRVDAVLAMMNIKHFDLDANAVAANLSEGEKQRLILARMLLLEKDVFFIDEGTSNLDGENATEIEKRLLQMPNTTVVIITHHLSHANAHYFDHVFRLDGCEGSL